MTAIPHIDFKKFCPPKILAADLYCGAGGASVGLHAAAAKLGFGVEGVAINHWDKAISTHSANFPGVNHLLTEMEKVKPREAVPGGKLHLLLAGPSCVHFSQARGGLPVSDQKRSGAWEIIHWARGLDIEDILVENVPAFLTWGPLRHKRNKKTGELMYHPETGQPWMEADPDRKEMYFRQWVRMLRDLGYMVEHRILCAADFGDPTSRQRLFIQARKQEPITWPMPSHVERSKSHAFPDRKTWRPARDIIDFSLPSLSIFGRKKQLADNTKARIFTGLDKVCGIRLIGHETMSWDRPPLVLLRPDTLRPGKRLAFVLGQQSCAAARSLDAPIPTVATAGAISLVEASFVLVNRTHCHPTKLDDPIRTLTTGRNMALVSADAFAVSLKGTKKRQLEQTAYRLDEPIRTIHAGGSHEGLCEAYLLDAGDASDACIIRYNGGPGGHKRCQSPDDPLTTIDTSNRFGLLEPSIISYYGNSQSAYSVDEPLDTITTRDRFGLIEAEMNLIEADLREGAVLAILDIHFRMFQSRELARGHSFSEDYIFAGNNEDVVCQIGNSWPVKMSEALSYEILSSRRALVA